jgi:hypothetical protein
MLPDGGAPSNPGFIDCGGSKCDLSMNVCCERFSLDGGSGTCQPKAQQCMGISVECKESGDCKNGQVCCLSAGGGGTPGATCQASCTATEPQLCRCDEDCPANKPCTPQTCFMRKIEACGVKACP